MNEEESRPTMTVEAFNSRVQRMAGVGLDELARQLQDVNVLEQSAGISLDGSIGALALLIAEVPKALMTDPSIALLDVGEFYETLIAVEAQEEESARPAEEVA